jgi:hypothetical protein
MYPAEVQCRGEKERKKERKNERTQHHTIKVLVSFYARIKGCGQPLSASGEMKNPCSALGRLKNLGLGWRRQLGAEDAVPEAAGDAEAVLVVGEVVLKVVFLECVPVCGETVMFVSNV